MQPPSAEAEAADSAAAPAGAASGPGAPSAQLSTSPDAKRQCRGRSPTLQSAGAAGSTYPSAPTTIAAAVAAAAAASAAAPLPLPPQPPRRGPAWPRAVASAALSRFAALPRTGKPQGREWTVLAAFLITETEPEPETDGSATLDNGSSEAVSSPLLPPRVVALGTGTKCLGAKARCPAGGAVHDSHAEVIARRALHCWLVSQMLRALAPAHATHAASGGGTAAGNESVFVVGGDGFLSLRPEVELHFYVSCPPCGDAAIPAAPAPADEAATSAASGGGDHGGGGGGGGGSSDAAMGAAEAHAHQQGQLQQRRTGAKVAGDVPLPCGSWREAASATTTATTTTGTAPPQAPGVARRKPGRGDPTPSMSCSDKLCAWAALGPQGCALSGFLKAPLRIATVTLGGPVGDEGEEWGEEAQGRLLAPLRRALVERVACVTAAAAVAAGDAAADGAAAAAAAGKEGPPSPRTVALFLPPPELFLAPAPPAFLAAPPAGISGGGGGPHLSAGPSPCGFSIGWSADGADPRVGTLDVVLGTTGRKAGAGKRGAGGASSALGLSEKTRSRLCRAAAFARLRTVATAFVSAASTAPAAAAAAAAAARVASGSLSYYEAKAALGGCNGCSGGCSGYLRARARLRAPPSPLAGWVGKAEGEQSFGRTAVVVAEAAAEVAGGKAREKIIGDE